MGTGIVFSYWEGLLESSCKESLACSDLGIMLNQILGVF